MSPATCHPSLSVVMPARNALPFLDSAVESILRQSFRDFEFIILDDGSTDGTLARLREWAAKDARIRLYESSRLGPAGSSNFVVRQARAPLVARMDADDVCCPDRLERQLAIFATSPRTVLAGTLANTIDAGNSVVRTADYWRVGRNLSFPPFPHTSIMFRRSAFETVGGYRSDCDYYEDLDLYIRLARHGSVAVIAEALVSHRASASSVRLEPSQEARIEAAVDRMYARVSALAKGEPYDKVDEPAERTPGRVRPMAIVSISSGRLWSGERPRALRPMLSRGHLKLNLETGLALGWATLGAASPGTLRLLLRALLRARALLAAPKVRRGGVYQWRPRGPADCSPRPHPTAPCASQPLEARQ